MSTFQKGVCEHCLREFNYQLWHAGFSDFSYAYCDACGLVATLSYQGIQKSFTPPITAAYREIDIDFESLLKPCNCGGSFRKGASPRCPHCGFKISAKSAASYIEANAPGTSGGWRWQRNWSGLYCIAIEDPTKPGSLRCTVDPYLDLELCRRRVNKNL